jgi:hypothetical protein
MGEQMDEEWQLVSSSWHKTKSPPATATTAPQSKKHPTENSDAGNHQHHLQVNNIAYLGEGRRAATPAVIGSRIKSSGDNMVATIKEKARRDHHPPQAYNQNRLSSLLNKHKNQLKETARKCNVLEKELLQDISHEADSVKQQAALNLGSEALGFNNSNSSSAAGRKRRSRGLSDSKVPSKNLLSVRCKLYRLAGETKEWKEMGVGEFKILRCFPTESVRFIMRREEVLEIKHFLTADMEITPLLTSDRAWTWTAPDIAEGEAKNEQFALEFETAKMAANWKRVVDSCKREMMEKRAKSYPEGTREVMLAQYSAKKTDDSKVFGTQFAAAQKASCWECSGCLTRNDCMKIQCLVCEATKPGHEEDVKKLKEAAQSAATCTLGASEGGLMFESSASATSFSATTIGFTYDSMSITPAATTSAATEPAGSFACGTHAAGTISSGGAGSVLIFGAPVSSTTKRQPLANPSLFILGREKALEVMEEKADKVREKASHSAKGSQVEPAKEAEKELPKMAGVDDGDCGAEEECVPDIQFQAVIPQPELFQVSTGIGNIFAVRLKFYHALA